MELLRRPKTNKTRSLWVCPSRLCFFLWSPQRSSAAHRCPLRWRLRSTFARSRGLGSLCCLERSIRWTKSTLGSCTGVSPTEDEYNSQRIKQYLQLCWCRTKSTNSLHCKPHCCNNNLSRSRNSTRLEDSDFAQLECFLCSGAYLTSSCLDPRTGVSDVVCDSKTGVRGSHGTALLITHSSTSSHCSLIQCRIQLFLLDFDCFCSSVSCKINVTYWVL